MVIPALELWITSGKSPQSFQSSAFLLSTVELMLYSSGCLFCLPQSQIQKIPTEVTKSV